MYKKKNIVAQINYSWTHVLYMQIFHCTTRHEQGLAMITSFIKQFQMFVSTVSSSYTEYFSLIWFIIHLHMILLIVYFLNVLHEREQHFLHI